MDQTVIELASIGGVAIVQAMATDAWITTRTKVAELISHGNKETRNAVLARLDTSREAIISTKIDSDRVDIEEAWAARLLTLFEESPDTIFEIRSLIELIGESTAGPSSPVAIQNVKANRDAYTAGRDLTIRPARRDE